MPERPGAEPERFRPSGQLTGWLCVTLAVAVAVLYAVEHDRGMPLWVLAAAACFGAVAWAVLLRPRVALLGRALELRGSFDTVLVPLTSIDEIAIGRVLSLTTGERRWTSAALGRSVRQARRDDEAAAAARGGAGGAEVSYAAVVERRLQDAVSEAHRTASGRSAGESVVRRRAWPELAAVSATAVATVLLLLL